MPRIWNKSWKRQKSSLLTYKFIPHLTTVFTPQIYGTAVYNYVAVRNTSPFRSIRSHIWKFDFSWLKKMFQCTVNLGYKGHNRDEAILFLISDFPHYRRNSHWFSLSGPRKMSFIFECLLYPSFTVWRQSFNDVTNDVIFRLPPVISRYELPVPLTTMEWRLWLAM